MTNRLRDYPTQMDKEIDFSSINFELPEFTEISQMVNDFCDKPGLWEGRTLFEQELTQMSFENLYDLYVTRWDLEPWTDKNVINFRSKQIEKALWNYFVNTGASPEDFARLDIDTDQMNNIYKSLELEYSH